MENSNEVVNAFNDIDTDLPDNELKNVFIDTLLKKSVDVSDKIYKYSFRTPYRVNLDLCGVKASQLYEPTKYEYKTGEFLDDPDVIIRYWDINFIRQQLRREKVETEMGRDKNNKLFIMRKDILLSTRTGTNQKNAQVLLAKMPIFEPVVQNFGSSRQVRPLRDEPEPIDPVKPGELPQLLQKMLKEPVDISDETYQKNFHDQGLKVNWQVDGSIAYQIFEGSRYHYEFGKHLDDADLTLNFDNPELAKRFFLKASTNFGPKLDDDKNLLIYMKIPVMSAHFKDPEVIAYVLLKIPFFRTLSNLSKSEDEEEKKDERENYGHLIPVNLPIGDFEDVVVPYRVFEHFINKASNIVLRTCPCRERWGCKNHKVDIGCIFMGDDTKNMVLAPDEGYVATKEQAMEHLRQGIADGLVPLLGRVVQEAEDGHGVADTGHFLSGCFCCECCCIGVKSRQIGLSESMGGDDDALSRGFKIVNNDSKCVGCGKCVEACPYNVMKLVDGKATVNLKTCTGCGRCVQACPNDAISLEIEDPDYIEKFIAKIESLVDVEDQSLKVKN